MAVKYIQKNKNGLWAISNSKAGKTLRTTNTQKEAIAIAGSQKTTEGIMIKRASGWTQATGWDQQVANSTKSVTTLKEEKGVPAKKPAVKKAAAKKPVAKKAPVKKAAPKKVVAKKPVAKKATPKKVVAKKPVAKKAAPKKVVAKKAPVKKVEVKKETPSKAPVTKKAVAKVVAVAEVAKPNVMKKGEAKKEEKLDVVTNKPKKGINGYLGLLIGLSIIGVVIGGAFLLGYFL